MTDSYHTPRRRARFTATARRRGALTVVALLLAGATGGCAVSVPIAGFMDEQPAAKTVQPKVSAASEVAPQAADTMLRLAAAQPND